MPQALTEKSQMFKWLVCLSLVVNAATAAPAQNAFTQLLDESQLIFKKPAGFIELEAGETPLIQYEHALRSSSGKVEIRIMLRPLKRLQIDYDDPHGAVPEPNHIFPLMFESLTAKLSKGGHTPSNTYPAKQAKQKFNADWAAVALFDVDPQLGAQYQQGLLLAIHRNHVADAYLICLFDDYKTAKPEIQQALYSIAFAPT